MEDLQAKNKFKITLIAAAGSILAGCTCVGTHIPGRHIDHGKNPDGIDRFFCNLDYILFPPQRGYVAAPPPPPAHVTYGYDWWKGSWVPRYQNWYWYHGTWEWGGRGPRPVPPAWAPDTKRHPMPPPPQKGHPAIKHTAPHHSPPAEKPVPRAAKPGERIMKK